MEGLRRGFPRTFISPYRGMPLANDPVSHFWMAWRNFIAIVRRAASNPHRVGSGFSASWGLGSSSA
jgi:hypothetical protein